MSDQKTIPPHNVNTILSKYDENKEKCQLGDY